MVVSRHFVPVMRVFPFFYFLLAMLSACFCMYLPKVGVQTTRMNDLFHSSKQAECAVKLHASASPTARVRVSGKVILTLSEERGPPETRLERTFAS